MFLYIIIYKDIVIIQTSMVETRLEGLIHSPFPIHIPMSGGKLNMV